MLLTARNRRNVHGTPGKPGVVSTFLPLFEMLGKYVLLRTKTHVVDITLLCVNRWRLIPPYFQLLPCLFVLYYNICAGLGLRLGFGLGLG